jgi:hypothetical protein
MDFASVSASKGNRNLILRQPLQPRRLSPAYCYVKEGGENVTLSRKTFWIGAGLVALVVLSVVLVVYSGGGSGGVGGGY